MHHSAAGVAGFAGASAYSASKFAVEGLSEALAQEIAPLGIRLTIVEPGYFRTDFLSPRSLRIGAAALSDYAPARDRIRAFFEARNGRQVGDPERLARALVTLVNNPQPPLRFLAGTAASDAALQSWTGCAPTSTPGASCRLAPTAPMPTAGNGSRRPRITGAAPSALRRRTCRQPAWHRARDHRSRSPLHGTSPRRADSRR